MKVYAISCDWKEPFDASDINDAIGKIGPRAFFYNCQYADGFVDSHILIVSDNWNLTEEQIEQLWDAGDLNLCDQVFSAHTFANLLKKIAVHVTSQED